jgi:serine/threonine protein kinase/formylglycine-generating enzyme required for sulfatase activity
MNERELFLAALDIDDPAERQTFLQDACSDDSKLLRQVESLLASHGAQSRFLGIPVVRQLTLEPIADSGATVLLSGEVGDDVQGQTSSSDAEKANVMASDGDESCDEIPLSYLAPSSRVDSLGRLGHYEILEVVGSGAFGTVLKGFDEKLHRVVAIKVLAPEMASTSPARKRFLREARSSAAVRHDNVVSIYAVEDEPIPYLVMEYIPGQTLQQRLDGTGPLSIQEVLRIGKQIAEGLAAAHAQELIHRDIKPGNILLDTSVNDHVKITDFGLARTADDASMTQSGMIAGTPLYMAPEQALGQKLDQRADLFSFGSVLYQMLSGRPPFRAPNTVAVLKRVVEDAPRPIQEIIPEVPQWAGELIGHLHAKDPNQRYSSAREVSDILAQCLADVQEGRQPRIPTPSMADTVVRPAFSAETRPAARTLRKPLARLAAVAVVLMLALGFSEATGVTELVLTVVRLFTSSGTLVIELDDPTATVAINGEEVTIRGGGIEELTLRPGEYRVEQVKDGETITQELVSITRGARSTVRMTPVSSSVAEEGVDLIQLLEPARDFLDDRLKIREGKLITPQFKSPGAIGMIPYAPVPDSYDIRLRLQRLSNHYSGFNFGIVVGGRQVCVGMDCGFQEKVWGLDFLDGFPAHRSENPTRNAGRRLIVGQTSDVRIQVRKNHVTASCDGEVLIDWTGDPELLSFFQEFGITKSGALFFVAQADFIVHEMTLIPRSAATSPVEADELPSADSESATTPTLTKAPFDERQAKWNQKVCADSLGVPVEKDVVIGQDKDGNDIQLTMVLIPPGEFVMGTSTFERERLKKEAIAELAGKEGVEQRLKNTLMAVDLEGPQRVVRITKAFWLSRCELTIEQFRQFVQSTGHKTESEVSGKGGFGVERADEEPRFVRRIDINWESLVDPSAAKDGVIDQRPVVNVSWNDAVACCRWLSSKHPEMEFSLPTEAQWEYACRAGTTTPWFGSSDIAGMTGYGYVDENSHWIHNVGELRANAFGLYDMHGNVGEWCADWCRWKDYDTLPADDPLGGNEADGGIGRAVRGGWFSSSAVMARSAKRSFFQPEYYHMNIGFRVAAAIPDEPVQAPNE